MTKTQEELTQLKQEYETLTKKLKELSSDELKEIAGGNSWEEDWGVEAPDAGDLGYYEPFRKD